MAEPTMFLLKLEKLRLTLFDEATPPSSPTTLPFAEWKSVTWTSTRMPTIINRLRVPLSRVDEPSSRVMVRIKSRGLVVRCVLLS